jgi:N-acetyl-alpha-D-muramate 1-phosphate uridylyltransferase
VASIDAFLLAAGIGTRLRPLTERTPKALIDIHGTPILERIARRLIAAGADRIVINVHHLADQIEAFVRARDGFGVEVLISREEGAPLETGGGLLHAAHLFRGDRPILVHNSDILCDASLAGLVAAHRAAQHGAGPAGRAAAPPLATMAVLERPSPRRLLFDEQGLYGRSDARDGTAIRVREPRGAELRLPFAGFHVVEPALLDRITEQGAFSILEPYLRLAAEGERIAPHRVDGCTWLEVGSPERLEEARRHLARQPDAGRLPD